MVLKVYSDEQLDKLTYAQIRDILRQSQCPNESLAYTFGDCYHAMVDLGDTVQVYFTYAAPDDAYCYEIQI